MNKYDRGKNILKIKLDFCSRNRFFFNHMIGIKSGLCLGLKRQKNNYRFWVELNVFVLLLNVSNSVNRK